MWSIFDDEHIIQEILNLKKQIRQNSIKSNVFPKFVFICGEQILDENGRRMNKGFLIQNKNKRFYIMDQFDSSCNCIETNHKYSNSICIISEKLYDSNSFIDLLTFEELLAEVSDVIIIIVESCGTICELGAFSIDNDIVEKLYVINDSEHENEKSFINDGPIEKIKSINEHNVVYIENDFNEFKKDFRIRSLITDISKSNLEFKPNLDSSRLKLKSFIYELINIIEIFQPITSDELIYLYCELKDFTNYEIENKNKIKIKTFNQTINLMGNMGLIFNNDKFLETNPNITCYNALFKIDRACVNSIRAKILNRIYKNSPERMMVRNNEYNQIN